MTIDENSLAADWSLLHLIVNKMLFYSCYETQASYAMQYEEAVLNCCDILKVQ